MGRHGPGFIEVTQLVLAEREWFPIGTPGGDSLALALAGLTGLADGEAVAIQMLARPASQLPGAGSAAPPDRSGPGRDSPGVPVEPAATSLRLIPPLKEMSGRSWAKRLRPSGAVRSEWP